MQQISAAQLAIWLADDQRPPPVLLDVREPWEFASGHIAGSIAMPMNSVPARYMDMAQDALTVTICHHGQRSLQIALFLERKGFSQVLNLAGGIAAWEATRQHLTQAAATC
ncbi:MAG: sulfurtransferase [Sterolibacterium sp.]|nr:sulfurtransferase [Sterolibacterium sp.]